MDEQKQTDDCLLASFKGNLRIRVHEVTKHDGSPTYVVEIAAWNSWAGQGKILLLQGGLDLGTAHELFTAFTTQFRGYDWIKNELEMET